MAGNPTIKASYGGDAGNSPSNGSTGLEVAIMTGLKNLVTLSSFKITDDGGVNGFCSDAMFAVVSSCFSIQQNFYITQLNTNKIYWAQNVMLVAKSSGTITAVLPSYNFFNATSGLQLLSCSGTPVSITIRGQTFNTCLNQNIVGGIFNTEFLKLPFTFNLTSSINNGVLTFYNNFGSASLPSSLTFSPGSIGIIPPPTATPSYDPELVLVGAVGYAKATFSTHGGDTQGTVQSSVKLSTNQWIDKLSQTKLCNPSFTAYCGSDLPSTGETSVNLSWTISSVNTASFSSKSSSYEQGVAYYETG